MFCYYYLITLDTLLTRLEPTQCLSLVRTLIDYTSTFNPDNRFSPLFTFSPYLVLRYLHRGSSTSRKGRHFKDFSMVSINFCISVLTNRTITVVKQTLLQFIQHHWKYPFWDTYLNQHQIPKVEEGHRQGTRHRT